MKMVSDLRFCPTCGGTRTVNGTSAASSAVPGDFEHDHAVFGLDGTIAESLSLSVGQTSSSACAAGPSRSRVASAAAPAA